VTSNFNDCPITEVKKRDIRRYNGKKQTCAIELWKRQSVLNNTKQSLL